MASHSKTRLAVYWSAFAVLAVCLVVLVVLKTGADARRDYQQMRDNIHSSR